MNSTRHVAVGPRRRIEDRRPTSCRGRAARTSGRCGSSRTRAGNARGFPASSRRPAAGRRPRRGARDCRRYGRRCRKRCGWPWVLRTVGERTGRCRLRALARSPGRRRAGGARRLGQAQMAVAEGIDHARRWRGHGPMAGRRVGQRRAEAHPLRAAVGLQARQEGLGACVSMASARLKLGGRSSPPSSTAPPTRMPVDRRETTKPWPPKVICVRRSKASGGQGGIVAALGLQRDAFAQACARCGARRRRRPAPHAARAAAVRVSTPPRGCSAVTSARFDRAAPAHESARPAPACSRADRRSNTSRA